MTFTHKAILLIIVAFVGAIALALGAHTVVETGRGADFSEVFNEPARTADTDAELTWFEGEPLLRSLEPQTIEAIEFAWTRALSAVDNAAGDGDTTGVDIWFSGPAQDQVHELLATNAVVGSGAWTSHDITPNFYSIDGQILVTNIERTGAFTDEVRVVFILRDGNWRVEHLVRTA